MKKMRFIALIVVLLVSAFGVTSVAAQGKDNVQVLSYDGSVYARFSECGVLWQPGLTAAAVTHTLNVNAELNSVSVFDTLEDVEDGVTPLNTITTFDTTKSLRGDVISSLVVSGTEADDYLLVNIESPANKIVDVTVDGITFAKFYNGGYLFVPGVTSADAPKTLTVDDEIVMIEVYESEATLAAGDAPLNTVNSFVAQNTMSGGIITDVLVNGTDDDDIFVVYLTPCDSAPVTSNIVTCPNAGTTVVLQSPVNVRSASNTTSNVVQVLPAGTTIVISNNCTLVGGVYWMHYAPSYFISIDAITNKGTPTASNGCVFAAGWNADGRAFAPGQSVSGTMVVVDKFPNGDNDFTTKRVVRGTFTAGPNGAHVWLYAADCDAEAELAFVVAPACQFYNGTTAAGVWTSNAGITYSAPVMIVVPKGADGANLFSQRQVVYGTWTTPAGGGHVWMYTPAGCNVQAELAYMPTTP